ncbi:MAG: alpha-tubulin suppressor [Gracilibacteraceae bacterium]|jgi:alpha-tubulin suppressor-like RCC1 family protein|nr:alpha-tubulin suppressor [Gracilibacteraceae bacterium]
MNAFLTAAGRVYTIGDALMGTLGTGKIDDHAEPTYVPMPSFIRQLEANDWGFNVLTAQGEVYNWGWCRYNMLGHGEDKSYLTPQKLPLPETIIKIRSGIYSTAARGESGAWYMWGDNTYGALGTGDMEFVPGYARISPPPEQFTEISPSWSQFLGLTAEGTVYQWGTGRVKWAEEDWKSAVSFEDLSYKKIDLPEKIIKIHAAGHTDYALAESGNLYIWGKGSLYHMGNDDETEQYIPQVFLPHVQDFAVSAKGEDMLALTDSGEVYYWGGRHRDIFGVYSPILIPYPEKIIAVFPGEGIFYVAGERHMYRVDSTWLEEGMVSDEFPRELNYKYQSEAGELSHGAKVSPY